MIRRLVFFAIIVPVWGGGFIFAVTGNLSMMPDIWFFIRMSLFLFIMNLLIDIYIRITGKHK
ncbi:hypothetical protein RA05_004420 [Escherichia coli]|nr:hypothetical protein [Escherichia coli]MBL5339124.1 hypothetical protein [Escherichia coli O157:H7]MED6850001.1 hypothetical protein [Escherichia coli O157]EEQ6634043.1 hypothetical protein [Escherichia coli]EEV9764606.1 hypothetical protein [Escherichia coli]